MTRSLQPVTSQIQNQGSVTTTWISTEDFASLVGFTERAARDALFTCINGGAWRGANLIVRVNEGTGGQGGKSYQVNVPSLPENLRDIWYGQNKKALNLPKTESLVLEAPSTINPAIAAEVSEWKWKLTLIAPALQFEKRSLGRGQVIEDIARKTHIRPDGKSVTLSQSTIRNWIKTLEDNQDETALVRKRRQKHLRRNIINRHWDSSAPFPEAEKRRIAAEIETYVRSLWAQGVPGWHKVNELSSSKLLEISRAEGWADADKKTCQLGRHYCERYRSVQIVAIKEKDAKRFADDFEPRIKRNREDAMPMDIVIGDVHPVDILIKTEDGREITPRMIAWVDWATHDIHSTLVFLEKRQGIRQEHIARSFVAMVNDWGLPRRLYLDNGSEYKWAEMIEGFNALSGLARNCDAFFDAFIITPQEVNSTTGCYDSTESSYEINGVIRAKPYNAPAKYAEAVFGNLEQHFLCMIPGWIGGNRMKKRTHRLGKAPITFPGNEQDLEQAIQQALDFYRNTEHARGDLKGKSPKQKRIECYANGWQPYKAPYEVFLFAFSTKERPKVMTGGIQVNAEWYYHDCLIPYIGQRLTVHAAKWDKTHVIWLDQNDNDKVHLIPKVVTYRADDRAGAIEQARRKSLKLDHVRKEKSGTVKLDMVEEISRHNAQQPAPPPLPKGVSIGMTDKTNAIEKAMTEPPKAKVLHLFTGDVLHEKTGSLLEMAAIETSPQVTRKLDLDRLLIENSTKKTTDHD